MHVNKVLVRIDPRDYLYRVNEVRITCGRGDVLLMRPLVSHCSGHSHPDTSRHRRILHLEFSPVRDLPAGYERHTLVVPGQNWK